MQDLTVTFIQSKLHWQNVDANLKMFEEKIDLIGTTTDLIILPEMFTTGFSMNALELAEPMNGKSVTWMADQAKELNAVITGSLIIQEAGKYFNRLIWMRPDGSFTHYDKRHLFTMANEHLTYTAGDERLIVSLNEWRICPLICYDLRFPVWARNRNQYDLLIYTANWPVQRSFHWKVLLQARAIENQCFTVGVNRCGIDGNGHYYTGDSCMISPSGEIYAQAADVEIIETRTLSYEYLRFIRKKLPFLADADDI